MVSRHVILNFDEARVPRLIEQERVTITNLVPTMGAILLHGDRSVNTSEARCSPVPPPAPVTMVERPFP